LEAVADVVETHARAETEALLAGSMLHAPQADRLAEWIGFVF
jgi:K+-sensing histidine kinase KdpD